MPGIIKPAPSLSYPANFQPGFNASHPFLKRNGVNTGGGTTGGAFIPRGKTFQNLATGVIGTTAGGTPAAIADVTFGPSVTFLGGSDCISFPLSTQTITAYTFFGFCRIPSTYVPGGGGFQIFILDISTDYGVIMNNTGHVNATLDGVTFNSQILPHGAPYFIVQSFNSATVNTVMLRLDNGVLQYGVIAQTGWNSLVSPATMYIGGAPSTSNDQWGAAIGPCGWQQNLYLSLPEILQACEDPWSIFQTPKPISLRTPYKTSVVDVLHAQMMF